MRPSAGALLPGDSRDVVHLVADQRERLLLEHGHDDLSPLALGAGLPVLVEDLDVRQVGPYVEAALLRAFEEHRSGHLAGAVAVVDPDSGPLLELPPHGLGPGFSAGDGQPDLGVPADVDPQTIAGVRDVEHVGGGSGPGGDGEVLHELDLPLGVAGADGQHGGPDPLGTVVHSESAGEQAVSVEVLQHVLLGHAEGRHPPGEGFGPVVEVLLRVTDDRGPAGGAGGYVDPRDVVVGDGEELVRVVVAEVALPHERDLAERLETGYVVGMHARFDHPLVEEFGFLVHLADLRLQEPELHLLQLLPGHRLDLFVPECHVPTSCCVLSLSTDALGMRPRT